MGLERHFGPLPIPLFDSADDPLVLLDDHRKRFDRGQHQMAETIRMQLCIRDVVPDVGQTSDRCYTAVKQLVGRVEALLVADARQGTLYGDLRRQRLSQPGALWRSERSP